MTNPTEIARLYFELSNVSDFEGIGKLLTDTTVYISQTTGEYRGHDDIVAMQRAYHGKFSSLRWTVNSVKEVDQDTVLFDYNFAGTLISGEEVNSAGLEAITVIRGKIQCIEISNNPSQSSSS